MIPEIQASELTHPLRQHADRSGACSEMGGDADAIIKLIPWYTYTHTQTLAHSTERHTHTYIYAFVSGLINHHDLIFIPSAFISLQATLFGFVPPSFFFHTI